MDNVPEMARNDLVLETLLKLMKEDNPETRRNAVVTLFNVACSDQNTVRLARYRDGTILEALVDLIGSDDPSFVATTRLVLMQPKPSSTCHAVRSPKQLIVWQTTLAFLNA